MANPSGGFRQFNKGRSFEEVVNDLNTRIVNLEAHVTWETELRKHNPALQDLYEKFQATKKLIK